MSGKIKNICQLKYEQKRLQHRQKELELAVRKDWNAIKKSAQQPNIIYMAITGLLINQFAKRNIETNLLNTALSYLTVFKPKQK